MKNQTSKPPTGRRMKRLLFVVAIVAVFALVSGGHADAAGGTHYYLALGDSLARSAQPNGDYQHGYAEQLLANLQQQNPSLQLVKLGCGGATTADMIYGSPDPSCAFPHKTQLAEAVAFLQAHRRFVSLVSIDVGSNDYLQGASFSSIQGNLATILVQLRTAAGPDMPIVGMNYYDPFVADVWFATHDISRVQAEANSVAAFDAFILGPVYAAAGDPVADVLNAFQVTNTTLIDTDGNGTPDTPLDVVNACRWTWECIPPPLGPDVHPNTAGYGVIAQAFLDAMP
jgi:lysophospholipase L1-like esterase